MDFERVLRTLLAGFHRERVRYGLIGGVTAGSRQALERQDSILPYLAFLTSISRMNPPAPRSPVAYRRVLL